MNIKIGFFLAVVLLVFAITAVSCNELTPSTTPSQTTQAPGSITQTTLNSDIPTNENGEGDTASTPNDTLTDTESKTAYPTIIETPVTTVVYEDRFSDYTAIDFDMYVDTTDLELSYAVCGKGISIIGDLAIVSPKYGYNSRYTSYSKIVTIREDRKSDVNVAAWGIQCTQDTLSALDAMTIAFNQAFSDSPYKLLVRAGLTKSTDSPEGEFYNEHLTGRMLSLAFYDGSVTYRIDSTNLKEERRWLVENCAKFGFIIRYPELKEEVTGVAPSYSEFRYVGVPHSTYIYEHNLCLEEYIEKLTYYSYEKPLYISGNQDNYAVYYHASQEGGITLVPFDNGADFSISGDNINGFIVTVKLAPDAVTEL